MTSSPASVHDCIAVAERLNAGCQCTSLDSAQLEAELERVSPGFHEAVMAGRPHLFASSMVFVSGEHGKRMALLAQAVERMVALPAYQQYVFGRAPAIAQHDPGTPGVFLGYDFHVGERGPQLIEINTNAGGGLLNALLAKAQEACCAEVSKILSGELSGASAEQRFVEMFRREWATWCAKQKAECRAASADFPKTLAIVDAAPSSQFLYPEFVLFERMFRAVGIDARICDPAELRFESGTLWHGDQKIDMVYNRLTDFALDDPPNAALRDAWLADAALITPHPRAHALYADKRNLVALTDAALLSEWGVDTATQSILLEMIPRTELVGSARADEFWARRRQLFFKPATGYGSKAAYRGDKLTKRVFDEILAGDYVAQALVAPSVRLLNVDGVPTEFKLDLRNYGYAGEIHLIAARLWQGQTTNFRTPGGGFAPVLTVPCSSVSEMAR